MWTSMRVPTEETYNGKWEQQIVENVLPDKEVENKENGSSEIVDPNDGYELMY